MATRLTQLEVFEGSLVDNPANKHAQVVLFKRADGKPCDEDEDEEKPASAGRGGKKMAKEVKKDEAQATEKPAETAAAEVKPEAKTEPAETAKVDMAAELAKRDSEIAELRKTAADALAKAEAERDARLNAEYVKKAEEFVVLGKAEEVGPWLRKIEAALGDAYEPFLTKLRATQAQLEKSALFGEIGKSGDAEATESASAKIDKLATQMVTDKAAANYVDAIQKLGADPKNAALMKQYRAESLAR